MASVKIKTECLNCKSIIIDYKKIKRVFCSRKCFISNKNRKKFYKCLQCNKVFYKNINEDKSSGKYCSQSCYFISKKGWTPIGVKDRIGEKHPNWKGGKHQCPTCENKIQNHYSKQCSKCSYKNRSREQYKINGLKGLIKQQNMKEPTSIEKAVYDYLLLKGIIFEKQKLINGKFLVDAYIPSLNIVIEADGTYWHSLDRVKKRDKAKNAYLIKCGFNLIRLDENEIRSKNFINRLEVELD